MSNEKLQESLQPEVAAPVEQPVEQQADAVPEQAPEQKNNFEELRKQKARLERERDEALRLLKENEAQKSKTAIQQTDEAQYTMGLAENDIVEGKHLKQVNSEIKRLREELLRYQQQSSEMTTEARLKAQYPDFDSIVSKENVEALRIAHPEIAQTLNSSSDLYNKAASAYTLIKKLGINQPDIYAAEKARAQENASKPKPTASLSPQTGESPLSNANAFANGLSDDLKKNLYREMIESMKNK